MASCYAPDATFADPVFTDLRGEEVGRMWRMLTSRSTDLAVELVEHPADAERGTARWIATYTFGPTGRRVVNDVHSSYRFAGGLIAEQVDEFDFGLWARQALGPPAKVPGSTPLLRALVRRRAGRDLERFAAGS